MKRNILLIISICLLCIITSGCGKDDYKVVNCTREVEATESFKTDMKYKLYYEDNYVMEMHSVEKITAEDSVLNQYKEAYEKSYSKYKGLEYYDYNINIKNGTLTSKVDIDYTKIDMDKLLEIDGPVELKEEGSDKKTKYNVYKDGKVLLDESIKLYERLGAKCDK